MPHLPAAVLILIDRPHPNKQRVIAFAAAAAEQLRPITECHDRQSCLALILSRHIAAVVCALDPGEDSRATIEKAGGRLIVARESTSRIRRSVNQLVSRLAGRGMDSQEIAYVLDVPTADVRRSLAEIRRRESSELNPPE